MICKACQARGKTWQGDDPKCAFESGAFSSDNWNCATMGKLRSILEYDAEWYEDMHIVTARVLDDGKANIGWIVLSWYKSRGRTGQALFIDDEDSHPLTIEEAEHFIDTHKELSK